MRRDLDVKNFTFSVTQEGGKFVAWEDSFHYFAAYGETAEKALENVKGRAVIAVGFLLKCAAAKITRLISKQQKFSPEELMNKLSITRQEYDNIISGNSEWLSTELIMRLISECEAIQAELGALERGR